MSPKKESMPAIVKLMTPFPLQVDCNTPIETAINLMFEHEVRHLIVSRDEDIYGLVSEHDLSRLTALYGSEGSTDLVVDDACNANIIVADNDDPLDKVLQAMWDQRIDAVVVLREGELAGIFTASDACRYFADFLREHFDSKDIPDVSA